MPGRSRNRTGDTCLHTTFPATGCLGGASLPSGQPPAEKHFLSKFPHEGIAAEYVNDLNGGIDGAIV